MSMEFLFYDHIYMNKQDYPLSNYDIKNLLDNNIKIVLYSELNKYANIDELLYPFNAFILLIETRPRYGHWVSVIKINDSDIEFFNSYGGYPDYTLNKMSDNFPYLSMLLYKCDYNLFYNEFAFQKHDSDVKTCGRHSVCRVMYKNLDIYEYKQILDKLCNKYKCDYDTIVTIITNKINFI